MRFERFSLTLCVLLLSVPAWGKQASQSTASPQSASDPQAIAVVQAAITALGGATAIGQAKGWTFQAQMQGESANGSIQYVMSTDVNTGTQAGRNGTRKSAPAIRSHFVPALVGAILLNESQDPDFSFRYAGQAVLDSKSVSVIVFSSGLIQFPSQVWYFDATNLPVQVTFNLQAKIGARQSHFGLVALSDYHLVSGVLYPFRIVTNTPEKLPQIIVVQSVNTSAPASPNEFNGPAGDL
jgi:hypothetical protein